MENINRRNFLKQSSVGLAAMGLGLPTWTLKADASPTPQSGGIGGYGDYLKEKPDKKVEKAKKWAPTAKNIEGPFYRARAPFRAKVSPPLSAGTVLLIKGRVWGFDSKKPLPLAKIDIWHASAAGRYDNDNAKKPPKKNVFLYRARLQTDENGYYEYETILPGSYKIRERPPLWRPVHIHYRINAKGYKELITQLYFEGDPYNDKDEFIDKSLIIKLEKQKASQGSYKSGNFDIVLAKK